MTWNSSTKTPLDAIHLIGLVSSTCTTHQPQSPDLHAASWDKIRDADGVLVPGGFGTRGIEGM